MRKTLVLVVAVIATVLLSGCGHNAITYGDGVGFDAGINPENFTMSFNLRYGKILSAVVRDNAEIELTGKADATGEGGSAGKAGVATDGNLKIKIGRQINGAAVDLVEAGADADKVLILPFQLAQCFLQSLARPRFRFPIVIIFQSGSDKEDSVIITPFSPAHTTGSIGFAIGISAAENHQYPIHLTPVLVITIGNTVLKHRISILRYFCFDNDCFRSKEQRKHKYRNR